MSASSSFEFRKYALIIDKTIGPHGSNATRKKYCLIWNLPHAMICTLYHLELIQRPVSVFTTWLLACTLVQFSPSIYISSYSIRPVSTRTGMYVTSNRLRTMTLNKELQLPIHLALLTCELQVTRVRTLMPECEVWLRRLCVAIALPQNSEDWISLCRSRCVPRQ